MPSGLGVKSQNGHSQSSQIASADQLNMLHANAESQTDTIGHEGVVDPIATHKSGRERTNCALPQVVSLFSGAGGMDLGFKQAGYTISVAIDSSAAAVGSHNRNFKRSKGIVGDLTVLKPAGVLELALKRIPSGSRIGVIGGPPCQGFSRANTNSQSDDPRNSLPRLYLGIVKELQKHFVVEFVVLENVLGIRDKKHARTYSRIVRDLGELGFAVTEQELCAIDFGVAQNRKRILLSGLRIGQGYGDVRPRKRKGEATVADAIGHIKVNPAYFRLGISADEIPLHPNHWTMQPKSPRFISGDFGAGGRSFKRLAWNKPSPTIAFGNREIHIHPNGNRRLSIYESLLLQGFPSSFVLTGNLSEQVEQISNAVPPPLARSVAKAVRRAMRSQ